MPVLEREDSFYPPTLLDETDPSWRGDDWQWWVLHTRSRQEKALARELRGQGIAHALPVVAQTTVSRNNRKQTSYKAIFSNYVFLYGAEPARLAALKTNRVANVLDVREAEELERDLAQIKRLIQMEAPLTIESKIEKGRRVRVKAGPFAGFEGVVTDRDRKTRLFVAVNYLQQGVSLEIDDYMVELI